MLLPPTNPARAPGLPMTSPVPQLSQPSELLRLCPYYDDSITAGLVILGRSLGPAWIVPGIVCDLPPMRANGIIGIDGILDIASQPTRAEIVVWKRPIPCLAKPSTKLKELLAPLRI